eukprot:4783103-Amphidinium_carterae.1
MSASATLRPFSPCQQLPTFFHRGELIPQARQIGRNLIWAETFDALRGSLNSKQCVREKWEMLLECDPPSSAEIARCNQTKDYADKTQVSLLPLRG